MKKKKLTQWGVLLIFTSLILFSCSIFSTMDVTDDTTLNDAKEIQSLIPGIEAALSVYKNSSTAKTFWPGVETSNITTANAGTPAELYSNNLASDGTYARYPQNGYMEDYYGTEGNEAYIELRKAADGWGDYIVTLYIYPVLSTSVHYTVEQYRVKSDSWDMVDSSGNADPTAYEVNKTFYFDGRQETRTVLWTRYVDDKVISASNFAFQDDPENLSITTEFTKDDIPTYSTVAATDGDDQFSSITESSIPATQESGYVSTWAKEFYSELSDGYHYSDSYIFDDLSLLGANFPTRTIRVYKENATTGDKQIRSKTAGKFSWFNVSWETTTTEKIDITNTDSGVNYSSTVIKKQDGEIQTKTTISLKETAKDSNAFEGTQTVEYYSNGSVSSTKTYTIKLDKDGLTITDSDGNEVASSDNTTFSGLLNIILGNGGRFSGWLTGGGILRGTYSRGLRRATLIAGRSFLKIVSGRNEILR